MDYKAIGLRVKAGRKKMGLTQEVLSEKLGISIEYTSRIESGSVKASVSLLEKICVELGMDEEELLFGRIYPEQKDDLSALIRSLPPEKKEAVAKIVDIIMKL